MAFEQMLQSSSFWREWDFPGCKLSNRSDTSLDSTNSTDSGCSFSLSRSASCSSSSSNSPSDLDYDCSASWESTSLSSLSEDSTDGWSRRRFPSQRYHPSGIMPGFNIWSPCWEDDNNLDALRSRAKLEEDSESSRLDWGCFSSWEAIPTPEEAEVLHAIHLAEEKRKEEEAAARRAAKKEAQLRQSYLKKQKAVVVRRDRRKEEFLAKMRGDDHDGASAVEARNGKHRRSGARLRPCRK